MSQDSNKTGTSSVVIDADHNRKVKEAEAKAREDAAWEASVAYTEKMTMTGIDRADSPSWGDNSFDIRDPAPPDPDPPQNTAQSQPQDEAQPQDGDVYIDPVEGKRTKFYDFAGSNINVDLRTPQTNQAFSSDFEHQSLGTSTGLSAERFTVDVQDQSNNPYEASNRAARKLSPFTISLLPPKEVMDAKNKSGTSETSDPYSWSGLSNLLNSTKVDIGGVPANLKGSDRIAARIMQDNKMNMAISGLEMLVYNGQMTPSTQEAINGIQNYNATPLFNVANIADIYLQLLEMFRTPPLILLVNPSSMSVNYSKIQNFQERTRYGYVYQAWGEQLPVLNFSGRIGAYYGGESPTDKRSAYKDAVLKNQETTHVSGVQEASRRVSPAYQNLMQLLMFYKNNGYIRDTVGESQANHLIGMVEISYDGVRYIGHFDKLEWTFEEANNLGGVNFSFDFTATRIVHTDERNTIPMKMTNPNQGHRFGDDRNDGRARTMQEFRDRLSKKGDEGSWWDGANVLGSGENTLWGVDEDGEVTGSKATRSWRKQARNEGVYALGEVVAYAADEDSTLEDLEEEYGRDFDGSSANGPSDSSGIVRYKPSDFED